MSEPMFPIMNDAQIKYIPWAALAPHEEQAKRNHGGQTLHGLSSRGGLDIFEAYYIMKDSPWPTAWAGRSPTKDAAYRLALMRLCHDFEVARAALSAREGSE